MNGGKSHMPSERVDEVLLVKYLLGSLTEEEQVEIEDRAFSDPTYLTALETAEADLIDAYIRGQLSQAERHAFERRFLTSPGRRSKIEFARALASTASESRLAPTPTPMQRLLTLLRGRGATMQMAAAFAMLILVLGASWLAVQNMAMRSRMAALEAQRHDLELREHALQRKLAVQSREVQSPAPAPTPARVVASLVLLPGLTRGEHTLKRLDLTPSTQIAHVEIQLEAADDYRRFRAQLRKRSGQEILTLGSLSRHQTGAGYLVSFDVPASALVEGEYELELKAILNDQSVQDVGYYYFSVYRH